MCEGCFQKQTNVKIMKDPFRRHFLVLSMLFVSKELMCEHMLEKDLEPYSVTQQANSLFP
jgi:hypothetical protein